MSMNTSNMSKEQIQRAQTKEFFLRFDQEKFIRIFSLEHDDNTFWINFIGKRYEVNRHTGEMRVDDREASIDEMASIFEYLTKSEQVPENTGKWESIASLCSNSTDTSLDRYIGYLKPFKDNVALMQKALLELGAKPANKGDVSAVLNVFDDVPVWIQYWAADDEFPASVQFLFDACILKHFRWSLLWNVMTCITSRMLEQADLHS